jgi:hypothetical protein
MLYIYILNLSEIYVIIYCITIFLLLMLLYTDGMFDLSE